MNLRRSLTYLLIFLSSRHKFNFPFTGLGIIVVGVGKLETKGNEPFGGLHIGTVILTKEINALQLISSSS